MGTQHASRSGIVGGVARGRARALGTALLLLLVGALGTRARPAGADYDETEARLKAAGVSADLRTRVHKAIDRCVAYLASVQKADGTFEASFAPDAALPGVPALPAGAAPGNTLGVTLLCTLALRHAGTPASEAPSAKAAAWLFDGASGRAQEMERSVYEAGLALLVLHALARPAPEAPRLASALARGLDEATGWWGYDTPGPADDPKAEPGAFQASVPNLSTAQFAALGLWAARRLGVDVHPSVWRTHAAALVESQSPVGSWPYDRGGGGPPGGAASPPGAKQDTSGYFTGTCMGLANLLLARQALKGPPAAPASVTKPIQAAIDRALGSLRANAPVYLADPGEGDILHAAGLGGMPSGAPPGMPPGVPPGMPPGLPPGLPLPGGPGGGLAPGLVPGGMRLATHREIGIPGFGCFYTLYALEKACLFADLEAFEASPAPADAGGKRKPPKPKPGRLLWYAAGAEWLLSVQEQDGGFATSAGGSPRRPSNPVDAALALLFLVRSPSAAHPTTPREVDAKPRGAVTPPAGR